MQLVVLITPKVEQGHALGTAWQKAGAPGVTFIESYGLQRLQETFSVEVMPGMLSMLEILRSNEKASIVLLSVVPDADCVEAITAATENILGDLSQPNAGVLFVLDVVRSVGLRMPDAS